jgi:hypothetical protein
MLDFVEILKPETDLERKILSDKEFIQGALYGKERRGHPEGQIIFHIREVLKNVNKYYEDDEQRKKLRLIALIHDTFKYQVDLRLPKYGNNHHSRLAWKFAQKYIVDKNILLVIKYHDDAYNIWKRATKSGDWEKAERESYDLMGKLTDLELYLIFYRCDNETGDKTQEDLKWFKSLI